MSTAVRVSHKKTAELQVLSPASLSGTLTPYAADSITKKNANKEVLLQSMGRGIKDKVLIVSLVLTSSLDDMTKQERESTLALVRACEHIGSLVLTVMVHATKDKELLQKEGSYLYVCTTKDKNMETMMSGVDLFVFVEKTPKDIEKYAKLVLSFGGTLSLFEATAPTFLEEYNPFTEKGNAFFYTEYSPWNMFAEIIRVREIYKFPYDWNTVRRVNMQSVE